MAEDPDGSNVRLPRVEFLQVTGRDFKEMREVKGTLRAIKTNTVIAQLDTRVVRCAVKVGDRVRAGQVIAHLDRKPTERKVREAREQLARAMREREAAEQESQRMTREIEETRAELTAAESRLSEVRRDAARADLALTRARNVAAQAKAQPPVPTTDSSAKILPLETEVAKLEAAFAEATASSKRRVDERHTSEKRFAKSQELYDVGAISRNSFESDRKKVDSAKQAEQSAVSDLARAREELNTARARLAKMRDTVRVEAASRAAQAAAPRPAAPASKETQEARMQVEESASALANIAGSIQQARERIARGQGDLKPLETRLAQSRENFTRAKEELANQTVLMGYCEVKATADGIVASIRGRGAAVKPGAVLCAIEDDSILLFEPHGLPSDVSIPAQFSLKSSADKREVTASVARDDKQELMIRIYNGDHSLRAGPASLEFVESERKRPAAPASALVHERGNAYVFVIAGKGVRPSSGKKFTVVRCAVTLGSVEGNAVEIASGLESYGSYGEAWIVSHPKPDWRERQEVRVK